MPFSGATTAYDAWSHLHYKVRVRATTPPYQSIWGSAGMQQNLTFPDPIILHVRNDPFGQRVTFGTQVVANPPSGPPIQTTIGILQPGECVSIPVQDCSGVFAFPTDKIESTVYCFIKST